MTYKGLPAKFQSPYFYGIQHRVPHISTASHDERNSATDPVHGMRRAGPRGTSAHRVPISVSRGGRVYEWSTAHAGRYERGG